MSFLKLWWKKERIGLLFLTLSHRQLLINVKGAWSIFTLKNQDGLLISTLRLLICSRKAFLGQKLPPWSIKIRMIPLNLTQNKWKKDIFSISNLKLAFNDGQQRRIFGFWPLFIKMGRVGKAYVRASQIELNYKLKTVTMAL